MAVENVCLYCPYQCIVGLWKRLKGKSAKQCQESSEDSSRGPERASQLDEETLLRGIERDYGSRRGSNMASYDVARSCLEVSRSHLL